MDDQFLEKINRIAASPLTEAEVQHLLILTRKLIERVPQTDRPQYALLRFYCDWTVHLGIDRSAAGAEILARIHELTADHLQKKDNSSFASDLSAALSLNEVRIELNNLIERFDRAPNIFGDAKWRDVIPILAEIISLCPLKISPKNRGLQALYRAIRTRPLKGTSVVEELAVVKIPSTTFNQKAPENEITYCLMLTTTDTTRIVTPLVRT